MISRLGNVLFGCMGFGLILLPLVANAQTSSYFKSYSSLLGRYCPAKHLEWISPADLNDGLDTFVESLTLSQKDKFQRTKKAVDAQQRRGPCGSDYVMGAGCANGAALEVLNEVKLLPNFAKMMCATPTICRGQSDCQDHQ